jgi:hypothetical protein
LFNLVQIESVLIGYQVDGQTQVTKSSRAANTMQIGFGILWEIKVDDNIDGLDVNTSGQEIFEMRGLGMILGTRYQETHLNRQDGGSCHF